MFSLTVYLTVLLSGGSFFLIDTVINLVFPDGIYRWKYRVLT